MAEEVERVYDQSYLQPLGIEWSRLLDGGFLNRWSLPDLPPQQKFYADNIERHLDLSPQDKDNLIRQSLGFMIPKMFAENLAEQKVNQLLADLVKFGMKQGSYEKHWREEIRQIGFWLGVFPAQFQAVEQQVKR